jgi:hypothetical protein
MKDLFKDPGFKEYARKYPQLHQFAQDLPKRFEIGNGSTNCDAEGCTRKVTPTTFHVFVTPVEFKPLCLCFTCLAFNYERHGGSKNFTHTRQ